MWSTSFRNVEIPRISEKKGIVYHLTFSHTLPFLFSAPHQCKRRLAVLLYNSNIRWCLTGARHGIASHLTPTITPRVRAVGPMLQMKKLKHREGVRVLLCALPTVSGRFLCQSQCFVLFSFLLGGFLLFSCPKGCSP